MKAPTSTRYKRGTQGGQLNPPGPEGAAIFALQPSQTFIEALICIPAAFVMQMEVDNVRRPTQHVCNQAKIGAIHVETGQIVGDRQICCSTHHDEVFVKTCDTNGKRTTQQPVAAMWIGESKCQDAVFPHACVAA